MLKGILALDNTDVFIYNDKGYLININERWRTQ